MPAKQYSEEEVFQLYLLFHDTFNYDPDTGSLTWKKVSKYHRNLIGKEVGTIHKTGYRIADFNGSKWRVHRICYLMYYGELPDIVDHSETDGSKDDNRICNLRDGSDGGNQRNTTSHKGATSPYLGVNWHTASNKWRAQIKTKGRKPHIGLFDSEIEAAKAYDTEARKYFKEYSNPNFPEETR